MRTVIFLLLVFSPFWLAAKKGSLEIYKLTNNCYVYTTYRDYEGVPFPSNGMYIVTDSGVVMIDMPWDTTQAAPLLDSIKVRHQKKVVLSVSTHFHDDRTGAVGILKQHGIATYCSEQTWNLCKQKGEHQPQHYFTRDTVFRVGGIVVRTYYPGAGHAPDNIVVWIPAYKVLYGGCFVKSTEAKGLGNLEDANMREWKISIRKVMGEFPDADFVIPGHQGWKDKQSLKHTLDLLEVADK